MDKKYVYYEVLKPVLIEEPVLTVVSSQKSVQEEPLQRRVFKPELKIVREPVMAGSECFGTYSSKASHDYDESDFEDTQMSSENENISSNVELIEKKEIIFNPNAVADSDLVGGECIEDKLSRKKIIPMQKSDNSKKEISFVSPKLEMLISRLKDSRKMIDDIRRNQSTFRIKTLNRLDVAHPSMYSKVSELSKLKEIATPKERIRINGQIREIQNGEINFPCTDELVLKDIFGFPIGRGYASLEQSYDKNHIKIGSTELIKGVMFDFVKLKKSGYCLRSTAVLADEGIEQLRKYIAKDLLHKRHRMLDNCSPNVRKQFRNKKLRYEIKKGISSRNSYDLMINGLNVHTNLIGKIQIFTYVDNDEDFLVEKYALTDKRQIEILGDSARYSNFKVWVNKTDVRFNEYVGKTFSLLAKVLNKIYARYYMAPQELTYQPNLSEVQSIKLDHIVEELPFRA